MRIILAALMVVSVLQQRAEACPVCSRNLFFPPTSTTMPLNARLRVLAPGGSSFELASLDGVRVPVSVEPIADGVVITPDQMLSPNTDYTLLENESQFQASFRTGALVDEQAAAAPVLGAVTHLLTPVVGRSVCDRGGETITIAMPITEGTYEIFVGPTVSTIDTTQPLITFPATTGFVSLDDRSPCGSNFPVSKTSRLAIAVREVDLAGNVSPLSDPLQLKGGGGCSATGGPGLVLLAGLLTRIWAKSRRKQAVG